MFRERLEDFIVRIEETLRGMDDVIQKENLEMDTGDVHKRMKRAMYRAKPNPSNIGNTLSIGPLKIKKK